MPWNSSLKCFPSDEMVGERFSLSSGGGEGCSNILWNSNVKTIPAHDIWGKSAVRVWELEVCPMWKSNSPNGICGRSAI